MLGYRGIRDNTPEKATLRDHFKNPFFVLLYVIRLIRSPPSLLKYILLGGTLTQFLLVHTFNMRKIIEICFLNNNEKGSFVILG